MIEKEKIYNISKKAFDKSAEHYEKFYAESVLNKRMRNIVWEYLRKIVKPGDKVLDLGCGVGIDSIFMAQLGANVTAVDISEKMVEKTVEKIKKFKLEDKVKAFVAGTGDIDKFKGKEKFNLVLSNFGPLNMEPELNKIAKTLYEIIDEGGILLANVINKYCLWEFFYFLLKFKTKDMFRRLKTARFMILDEDVIAWAYSPNKFYGYFKNYFKLKEIVGLNIIVPPPYMEKFYIRFYFLFKYLDKFDALISKLPVVRALGDHFLIIMQKLK